MAGLAGFDFDVGIVADAVTDPRFFCMLYDEHPVRIMVPHQHRLARRRSLRMADLEREDFILRDAGSATRHAFHAELVHANVTIRPIMEINVREAVREAVARGLGLGAISETEFAPHENIRLLPLTDANMVIEAYVVCLAARRNRSLVEAFVRLAVETAPNMAPASDSRRSRR